MDLLDPVENGAEGEERGEGGGQLIVARGDAAAAFQAGKEVFHLMPVPIVAAVEEASLLARGIERQAGKDVLLHQERSQGVGVVSFVGDQARLPALRSNLRARPCPSTKA